MKKTLLLTGVSLVSGVVLTLAPSVSAVTSTAVDFEPPAYSLGNIDGQQGWSKTGSYDVAVANNGGVAGFGTQT